MPSDMKHVVRKAKNRMQGKGKAIGGASMAMPGPMDDFQWKVNSAADSLIQAQKIHRDPKLYAAALKECARRAKELQAVVEGQ